MGNDNDDEKMMMMTTLCIYILTVHNDLSGVFRNRERIVRRSTQSAAARERTQTHQPAVRRVASSADEHPAQYSFEQSRLCFTHLSFARFERTSVGVSTLRQDIRRLVRVCCLRQVLQGQSVNSRQFTYSRLMACCTATSTTRIQI